MCDFLLFSTQQHDDHVDPHRNITTTARRPPHDDMTIPTRRRQRPRHVRVTTTPHDETVTTHRNVLVDTLRTSPCVSAEHPHVSNMWRVFCGHTGGRFERAHGHEDKHDATHNTHDHHTPTRNVTAKLCSSAEAQHNEP